MLMLVELIRSVLKTDEERINSLKEIKKEKLTSAKKNMVSVFVNLSGFIAAGLVYYFWD